MAQDNQHRINVVHADSSSVFDKYNLLAANGYFKRTRWERATVIDVLDNDNLYLDLMTYDKQYCDFVRDYSLFGHTVESTLYTDADFNQLLFATVALRKEITNDLTANQICINGSKEGENFVFASIFPNTNISTETGRGGRQLSMLQGIQLFRYDPTGSFDHENSLDIYEMYKVTYGEGVADLYRKYFPLQASFPHFHFLSKTMATTYEKTTEADAISLDMLITYVEDLMFESKKEHPLNVLDFGMPYLRIKNNPKSYKTCVDMRRLNDALINNNVNKQIGNIFKQTQKIHPDVQVLTGLDAVYTDLVLLRMLRGGGGPGAKFMAAHNPNPVNGGPPPRGGSGGSGGSGSLGGSGGRNSRNMSTRDFDARYMDRQSNEPETPQYEVSMAELQLASKVAAGGNMTLKNSNGRDKMHFEEADVYVDKWSYDMLQNVMHLCENQKGKGGNNGPSL